jgi:hypothetical protein
MGDVGENATLRGECVRCMLRSEPNCKLKFSLDSCQKKPAV